MPVIRIQRAYCDSYFIRNAFRVLFNNDFRTIQTIQLYDTNGPFKAFLIHFIKSSIDFDYVIDQIDKHGSHSILFENHSWTLSHI